MSRGEAPSVPSAGVFQSLMRSWPAWLMTAIVSLAGAFAFSPRPTVTYVPTPIKPDQLLITGLAESGSHLIASGELGHILTSDSAIGPWTEATIEPDRGSTITQVAFIGEQTALAVGHDGWILRSTDAGLTWKEVAFDAEHADPLMGIGVVDNKVYVVGSFGQLRVSGDWGQTWEKLTADAIGDHHLYGVVRQNDGSTLIVGEQGLMVRSTDGGKTWQALPQVYNGSFFGVVSTPAGGTVAFGMRGHVFRSRDNGKSWEAIALPTSVSLFGGRVLANGDIVLVGENRTVLRSTDGGAHFDLVYQGDHHSLDAVLAAPEGGLLTAGEGGIKLVTASAGGAK